MLDRTMLDKTVPYHRLYMRLSSDKLATLPEAPLPATMTLHNYEPGDETDWADITMQVGEFDRIQDGQDYFATKFGPGAAYLPTHMVFAKTEAGNLVGTACAWRVTTPTGARCYALEWVAVVPEYQHRGIGRALIVAALQRFVDEGVREDIVLATQTWSHRAIVLYERLGFALCPTTQSGRRPNEFEAGLAVLRGLYPDHTWAILPA